jgi:hypothetical protein
MRRISAADERCREHRRPARRDAMPRPKNYAFEKVQRERARLARKAARKEARLANPDGEEAPDPDDVDAEGEAEGDKDKDPEVG